MKSVKHLVLISILLIGSFKAFSQDDLTLYNIKSLPENRFQNPGKMPETRVNISLPVISSTFVGLSNSGFAFSDLVAKRPQDDSLILTTANMLSKLSANNLLSTTFSTEILGIGFGVKQNYYSFDARIKSSIDLSYTKDMMQFLLQGNSAFVGQQKNLGLTLNSTLYTEYGLGFTHLTKDGKLSYGGRLKILSGIANINTKQANIALTTDSINYAISATPNVLVNSSLIDTGTISNNAIGSNVFGPNKGFGIDLGAEYKLTDKITLSASVVDLGFINWKSNISNYQSDPLHPNFTFSGFDVTKFFNGSTIQPYLDTLSDSLKNTFYPIKTNNSYKTSLTTKIFAGATYKLTSGLDAGILLYGRFVNSKFYSGIALSLNEELGKWLNASVSFSRVNSTSNLGFGLSANLRPLQIYFVSDNIFALSQVDQTHGTNLHFGINISIGRVKNSEKTTAKK